MQRFSHSAMDRIFLLASKSENSYIYARISIGTYRVTSGLIARVSEKVKKENNCIAFAVRLNATFEEVL